MTLNLTQDQQEAFDKFVGFLLSNEKEFHLFGSAGCGKTFLTRHFVNQGLKDYKRNCKVLGVEPVNYNVAVTATTNKAAEVLRTNGFPFAETIFKTFNVKVEENYRTGETYLKEIDKYIICDTLIFIDECSMLPKVMKQIIQRRTQKCKIVYIGDNYQLAPVKEKPSWNSTPSATTAVLSIPVRNKNSQALINLCDQLRTTVDTQEFKDIQLVPGAIKQLDDDGLKQWLMNADFSKSKVLSYTNQRAIEYIEWIEKNRFKEPSFLREGQLYVNNRMFESKLGNYYPEEEVLIHKFEIPYIVRDFTGDSGTTYFIKCAHALIGSAQSTNSHMASIAYDPLQFKSELKRACKNKDWQVYFYMQKDILDLRLPYASTVHKAQGSSYDDVVIDLESFEACKSYSMASRLLYVAVSRARSRVFFYGELPSRFGTLVGD